MKVLKQVLKILFGILGILLILAVLGYFALTRWVDPDIFKPQIIRMVNQATGRTLALPGKLSWTFSPGLGIHIGEAALSNPVGFSQPTFAEISSADLTLNLDALLHEEINVEKLTVNGLQVNLIQNGSNNNWTFTSVQQQQQNSTPGGSDKQVNFNMGQLDLTDASLTYDNLQTKSHYVFNLNLNVPDFSLTQPMAMKLIGNLSSDNLNSSFKLDTDFLYDQTQRILSLNNFAFDTHATYIDDNGDTFPLNLNSSGNLAVHFAGQTANLDHVQFSLNQVLNGQLNLNIMDFDHFNYSGHLNLPSFSLNNLLNTFNKSWPDFPNKGQFDNVSLQTDVAGNLSKLSFQNAALGIGNTQVKGSMNILSFVPFKLTENVNINQIDLADFVNLKGARLVMQAISAKGNFWTQDFSSDNFPSTLNAFQKISIGDVTLKGFSLADVLQNVDSIAANMLNFKKISAANTSIQNEIAAFQKDVQQGDFRSDTENTDFGQLTTTLKVKNGVSTTPNIMLKGPLLTLSGAGAADLNAQTLNYQLNARINASTQDLIKSLVIPYHISGSFNNLNQSIDFKSIHNQMLVYLTSHMNQTIAGVLNSVLEGASKQAVAVTANPGVSGTVKRVSGALTQLLDGDKNKSQNASDS